MRLFAYKDYKNWGEALCNLFSQGAQLFTSADEVPSGKDVVCFVHMHHIFRRLETKLMMEELNRKELLLIPNIKEARLYDNKFKQYETFSKQMPKTWYIENEKDAAQLACNVLYPIVSKTVEGAGSSNVRLLRNKEDADKELEKIFQKNGLKVYLDGHYQKGYILWQEFIPNNDNDWRVILIAKKYALILKRDNRSDVPFASGSGLSTPIIDLNNQMIQLLDFTLNFAKQYDFIFTGIDIIYDKSSKPVVLESTTGWSFDVYRNCRFFEYQNKSWLPMKYVGAQTFDVVTKAILNGDFNL